MVLAALLLVGLGWDGQIGAVDGVLLLAVLVAFTAVVLRRVQQTQSGISAAERAEMPEARVRDAAAVVGVSSPSSSAPVGWSMGAVAAVGRRLLRHLHRAHGAGAGDLAAGTGRQRHRGNPR